jgi:exodeoxyribonuclease VII large subunit
MDEKEIYSVSELTYAIKNNLETRFPGVRVKGEVSNFKKQSSGHMYFTLKDAACQISVALFHGSAKSIKELPKDGDQVTLTGELSVYPARGTYQIIAKSIEMEGLGDLLLLLHKMKEELKELGWFNPEKKKSLPPFPKTIGVVTSPTGAVIQDILTVLGRRASGFRLILCPVKVQGPGAAEEIAEAIELFNTHKMADVLIVGRGGGSLEDLWAFNERVVAKAIHLSEIPIISAVGHETDFSIADLVADVRAPTPSAAAEIVMKEKKAVLADLKNRREYLQNHMLYLIQKYRYRMEKYIHHPAMQDPLYVIREFSQKVDDLSEDLTRALNQKIEKKRWNLNGKKELLTSLIPLRQVESKKTDLNRIRECLEALNPSNVLKKGYCIPFRENKNSVFLSAKELDVSEKIRLLFHDGSAVVSVEHVTEGVNNVQ